MRARKPLRLSPEGAAVYRYRLRELKLTYTQVAARMANKLSPSAICNKVGGFSGWTPEELEGFEKILEDVAGEQATKRLQEAGKL